MRDRRNRRPQTCYVVLCCCGGGDGSEMWGDESEDDVVNSLGQGQVADAHALGASLSRNSLLVHSDRLRMNNN